MYQEWFTPGSLDLCPSQRSFPESTSFYLDTDPACMLDTHHTADMQLLHSVSKKVHRTSIRVQPFRCIWDHDKQFLHGVSKKVTEPQYGYSHLAVYKMMTHNSYMVSPKKVLRTSKWVQSFKCLQYNNTQLLHGVSKRSKEPKHGYSHLGVYDITIDSFVVSTSIWTVGTLLAGNWIMCLILKKYNLLGT